MKAPSAEQAPGEVRERHGGNGNVSAEARGHDRREQAADAETGD
jgi:hypothetical protein